MEITPLVCRLCLSNSNILKSMFHCSIGSQTYAEIYETYTGYAVCDHPELPQKICNDCELNLISYHNFRVRIESVEERLQVYESQFVVKIDELQLKEEHQPTSKPVNDANDEEIVVEQLYEEDDDDLMMETVESNDEYLFTLDDDAQFIEEDNIADDAEAKLQVCRFKQSECKSKDVKCETCVGDCETEKSINEMKAELDFAILCVCSKTFKNRRSFLKHFATIHTTREANMTCRCCSETFSAWRSKIAHEAKVHSIGLRFKCSSCAKKFYRSDHWKEHEKMCGKVVDASEKFFSCSICLFNFQREDTFKRHLRTAHVGVDEGSTECVERAANYAQRHSKNRVNALEEAEESDKPPAVCSVCQKTFKNELSLSKHVSLFHTNQVWSCDKCDAVFVHRSTKLSHMSKEHGLRKPFECSIPDCGYSCFKKDRFKAHMARHENPDQKFPCPICQQEFKSYNTMTLHRARHTTKDVFTCASCSKQFLDKRNYNVHLKLHTGEDLFHCPSCSQGFNRKDHLQKHQKRKNHFGSGEARD